MKKLSVILIALSAMLSSCAVYDVPNHYQSQYQSDRDPGYVQGRQHGTRDRDYDGVPNQYDRDRDGDGVRNSQDRRPNDPSRY